MRSQLCCWPFRRIRLGTLITLAMLAGCSREKPLAAPTRRSVESPTSQPTGMPVTYDAATFRADVLRYVSARQFASATALVNTADLDRQLAFDGAGFVAVAEDLIVLPGVYPEVPYDPKRDWCIPGTGDVIQDGAWQKAATEFARRYNLRRARKSE